MKGPEWTEEGLTHSPESGPEEPGASSWRGGPRSHVCRVVCLPSPRHREGRHVARAWVRMLAPTRD